MKKTYKNIFRFSLVASILFFAGDGFSEVITSGVTSYSSMVKYHGRVADPHSGKAVKAAKVQLLKVGTLKQALMFADEHGKRPVKGAAVRADETGRYSFYAPNGRYRVRTVSPDGTLLYDHDDVSIYDLREAQTFVSDGVHPALSLYVPVEEGDINLELTIQKHTEDGKPIGAFWRTQTHLGEVGCCLWDYNTRRSYLNNKDIRPSDLKSEPLGQAYGSIEADDGEAGLTGIHITAGGLWHPSAHTVAANMRLPIPKDNYNDKYAPMGLDMLMTAPKGLKAGDVVALSLETRAKVELVSRSKTKLPFVVSKVNEFGTFVLLRGLAWVKVSGKVVAGDILVTSSKKGFAKAVKSNSDASCSLGVAVGKSVKGRVLIRIVRVNDIPK